MPREKKSNPYSNGGLDKLAHLNAELNARREQIARKRGVPKEAVRFAYHSKGWIPVVMKHGNSTDGHRTDGNSTEVPRAGGDSIVGPVETKAIQETKFQRDENLEDSIVALGETKAIQETKFERDEYLETSWNGGFEGIHGAIGMIVAILCMIFQGTLCAILWACAWCWWCVLAKLKKGKHGYFDDNKSRIRMTIDLELKRGKANMDSRDISEKAASGYMPSSLERRQIGSKV